MSRVEREVSPSDTRMLWNGWTGRDSGTRLGRDRDSGMPADDLLYIHKSGKRIDSWNFQMKEKKSNSNSYGGEIESKPRNNIKEKEKQREMIDHRPGCQVNLSSSCVVAPSRTTKMNNDIINNE